MFGPGYFNLFENIPADVVDGARRAFASRLDFGRPSFGFGPGGHRPEGGPECSRGRGPGGFGPGAPFGPGFGPFGGPGWGGAPHGRGRGRGRGHKRHHGRDGRNFDLRAAILTLLAEEPLHGYELMRRISERSDGAWRPSPGSIYPALAKLRDEGLVLIEEVDGRKIAKLTETGRAHVEEFGAELGEVWAEAGSEEPDPARELWLEGRKLIGALQQSVVIGDPDQLAKATEILAGARRKLFALLADDVEADEESEESGDGSL